jgi:hypothetical protein
VLEDLYWADARTPELSELAANARLAPDDLAPHWRHKAAAAGSALTKSGVGRDATLYVGAGLSALVDACAGGPALGPHAGAGARLSALAHAILRERLAPTAAQVENCIKPYKGADIDIEPREWETGRVAAIGLYEREVDACAERVKEIRKKVGGGRRLGALMGHVRALEARERARELARVAHAEAGAAPGEPEGALPPLPEQSDAQMEAESYRFPPAQVIDGSNLAARSSPVLTRDVCGSPAGGAVHRPAHRAQAPAGRAQVGAVQGRAGERAVLPRGVPERRRGQARADGGDVHPRRAPRALLLPGARAVLREEGTG